MRLYFKKYPKKDGIYTAANHNEFLNRLEIETVTVVGEEVFVEGDLSPFIFKDFDFWSDSQEETK